jgi:hypothetical protein
MRLKSRFVCRCIIIGVLSFLMRGFALLVLRFHVAENNLYMITICPILQQEIRNQK